MGLARSSRSISRGARAGVLHRLCVEAFDRKGELRAIAAGGRYNDLVPSSRARSAGSGFLHRRCHARIAPRGARTDPTLVQACDIYCVIGGEAERRAAFRLTFTRCGRGLPGRTIRSGRSPSANSSNWPASREAKLALIYGAE